MKDVPLIGDTYKLLEAGCIPGAAFRNLDYAEKDTSFAPDLDYNLKMAAFDAQTSGGLLISAPAGMESRILGDLETAGLNQSAVIGFVKDPDQKYLYINN
jgi:selenide,water dikinase